MPPKVVKKATLKAKSPLDDDFSPPTTEGETEQKSVVRQRVKKQPVDTNMIPKSDVLKGTLAIVLDKLEAIDLMDPFEEKIAKRDIAFCLKYLKEVQNKL